MLDYNNTNGWKRSDYDGKEHTLAVVDLLKLMRSDYRETGNQLDKLHHSFAERESIVNKQLQFAVQESKDYQALSLVPSGMATCSQLGKTTLGRIKHTDFLHNLLHLEARCFGKFEISSPWKTVENWKSMKAKSALQYFMTKPTGPIVKEVLIEKLWPESNPKSATNNLKAVMHCLRETLNQLFDEKENFPFILFNQGSYMINPEVDLWIDVSEFYSHWAAGRRLEGEGRLDQSIRELKLAESLYRGDYLEDELYEEWTLLQREALKDIYLIIVGKLAEHSIKAADYDGCIVYCQTILARDICREDAYRRLMQCFSRIGHRNRALQWYDICCKVIKTELEVTPDSETISLHTKLLKGEPI
jgi:DNA-binding SARP family transcriptional activator